MNDPEDLKFMDSGQDDVLFDKGDSQTHTFTNFPNSAVDEEEEETEDKSQLLKDDKKLPSFWTFEYYQQFFDVETRQVGHRVLGSMLPLPNKNYLNSHIRPSPDLYGPFWICTTLVFTTAIAGNLANYLSSGGKDYQWRYDFHKVTFAATAIFSYWWIIPAMLYGLLWWRKSQAGYTFLEILCLYGYSLAIYIPISILWVINITWLKWLLVVVGAVMSGGVLVISVWPAVKEDTKQVALIVTGLVFLFHLMLAAGFLLYFFHVPAQAAAPTTAPVTFKTLATDKPVTKENKFVQAPQSPALNNDNKVENKPSDKPGAIGADKTETSKERSVGAVDINAEGKVDDAKDQLDALSAGEKIVKRQEKDSNDKGTERIVKRRAKYDTEGKLYKALLGRSV